MRALGWRWLETDPFVAGDVAIIGGIGWYDYSFAAAALDIPERFDASKISPGVAAYRERDDLLTGLPADHPARDLTARWNDGKFVKLRRGDATFLEERLTQLKLSLDVVTDARRVIAAVHHLPFAALCPPPHRTA